MSSRLAVDQPLAPGRFAAAGVALFALKFAVDFGVARLFHHPYSVMFYVSPMESPLMHPGMAPHYWLVMWAVAIPFIAIGLLLTRRRVLDAGLPPAISLLFFVPFANLLFFLGLVAAPSRPVAAVGNAPGPYRSSAAARPPLPGAAARVLMPGIAGAVVGLGAMGISVDLLKSYGAALVIGAPAIASFTATLLHGRWNPPSVRGAVSVTLLSFVIFFGVVTAFALEGVVCLLMALPLFALAAAVGSFVAYTITRNSPSPSAMSPGSALIVLPALLLAEHVNPLPEPVSLPVESVVIVAAPPSVVWERVIAFPPLAPSDEAIFRLGVAAPMRAEINGQGVGAVRRCEFTTGAFVEPITVWNPGHELSFNVTQQPAPMRELTLWPGPRPPHLDGYIESTRGQFELQALPGNRTRLIGRTWYRARMNPEGYWRFWTDRMIHAIHLRVLHHVAALAEADVRE